MVSRAARITRPDVANRNRPLGAGVIIGGSRGGTGGAAVPNPANAQVVADIAARNGLVAAAGDMALVLDASGDPLVGTASAALYVFANAAWRLAVPPTAGGIQVVNDIAARDALAAPAQGDQAFVLDATADPEVGAADQALYVYDGAAWQLAVPPSTGTTTAVVADITARDAIVTPSAGDQAFVLDATADPEIGVADQALYVYDGAAWQLAVPQTASQAITVANVAARDALTGLQVGNTVNVIDNGGGVPGSFEVLAITDGAFGTSTTLQTGTEIERFISDGTSLPDPLVSGDNVIVIGHLDPQILDGLYFKNAAGDAYVFSGAPQTSGEMQRFISDGASLPVIGTDDDTLIILGHLDPLIPDGIYTLSAAGTQYQFAGAPQTVAPAVATTLAALQDITNVINMTDKTLGREVLVTDLNQFAKAAGAAAGDIWLGAGITIATPV